MAELQPIILFHAANLAAMLGFVIVFVSDFYNWCMPHYAQFSEKKLSLYISKWLSYNQLVFSGRHFVRQFEICNPICVKFRQLMYTVIMHNSVKKTKSSLYINKWLCYSQL